MLKPEEVPVSGVVLSSACVICTVVLSTGVSEVVRTSIVWMRFQKSADPGAAAASKVSTSVADQVAPPSEERRIGVLPPAPVSGPAPISTYQVVVGLGLGAPRDTV